VLRSGDSVVDKAGQVEQVSSIDNFMRLELFSDERSLRLRECLPSNEYLLFTMYTGNCD
jgi:hypothetical protein